MVEISVLDSNMELVAVVDTYVSFIWTDRYNEAGEFELVIPISVPSAKYIMKDFYLSIPSTKRLMIVESVKIETDHENGNTYDITGRSLETILDRRIVWSQTNVAGSIQNALDRIVNDAIVAPKDMRRRIDNFQFILSEDEAITGLDYTKQAQYMGDSVYEVFKKVCQSKHIGFKIEYENGYFKLRLFAGIDKSYRQSVVSYVVFSPNHDNLLSSKYLESIKNYKNVLRIAGEGEGATKTYITHYLEFDDDHASEMRGLARREIYIDCSDVSSITDGNVVMDVEQYSNTLVQKGIEKMVDLVPETAFEGEIDTTIMYKYHKDFEVGDICEIRDEYGMSDQVRITEVVQTWEASGYSCVPTLESLKSETTDYEESSSGGQSKIIHETVDTTSTELDTAGLRVSWVDKWNSSEGVEITYLSHTDVHIGTQLMDITYDTTTEPEHPRWKVVILKDSVEVKNILTGETNVYQKGTPFDWYYDVNVSLVATKHD